MLFNASSKIWSRAGRPIYVPGSTLLHSELTMGQGEDPCISVSGVTDPITAAMARYAVGEPIGFEPRYPEHHTWLQEVMDGRCSPEEHLAIVRVCYEYFQYCDRELLYYRRGAAHIMENLNEKIDLALKRLEAPMEVLKRSVVAYHEKESIPFVREVADGPIVCFPQALPKDIRRLFITFDQYFKWRKNVIHEWDDLRWHILTKAVAEHPEFFIVSEVELEELEEYKVGKAVKNRRKDPHHIYRKDGKESSGVKAALWQPVRNLPGHIPYPIERGDLLPDAKIEIVRISSEDWSAVKDQFLDKRLHASPSARNYVVLHNGNIVGGFGIDQQKNTPKGTRAYAKPWCDLYLMSDLAVEPTPAKRLGKLILIMATSKEMQTEWEQERGRVTKTVGSTAFSQHPESMKYRGIFDLVKRTPVDHNNSKFGEKFRLNYLGEMGRWTIQEGYERWMKRYNK